MDNFHNYKISGAMTLMDNKLEGKTITIACEYNPYTSSFCQKTVTDGKGMEIYTYGCSNNVSCQVSLRNLFSNPFFTTKIIGRSQSNHFFAETL